MDFEKNTTDSTPTEKQLRRTDDGRILGGVCSGAARYLGVDANIVRLGLAAFTFFNGAGVFVYALGWLVIPAEGRKTSIAQDLIKKLNEHPALQDGMQKAKVAMDGAMNKNVNKETKAHSQV